MSEKLNEMNDDDDGWNLETRHFTSYILLLLLLLL
jgi:hypothetical protein